MTDFPDRDEWTDRRDFMLYGPPEMPKCETCNLPLYKEMVGIDFWIKDYQTCKCEGKKEYADKIVADYCKKSIEAEKAALEREKAEQRATYDEAAEWDELDDTDLFSTEDRAKRTDLSNNDFSDV